MRKLKYILASVVIATGFISCDTEAIDEKLKDETVLGTPILRFELNDKQTIVTKKVTTQLDITGRLTINAKLSIPPAEGESQYKAANLTIVYSDLVVAHFPTRLTTDNPLNLTSQASLEIIGGETYSTVNAKENQQAGDSNITYINETGKYIEGNFNYILYPASGNLQPQRLSQGNYKYANY